MEVAMDGGNVHTVPSGLEDWQAFVTRCINSRLDEKPFEQFVKIQHNKHEIPCVAVANLFLRPQKYNRNSLDPRILSVYLPVLLDKGYVDVLSVLRVMFIYSTLHVKAEMHKPPVPKNDGTSDQKSKEPPLHWTRSYCNEEVLFYRLTRAMRLGTAITIPQQAFLMVSIAVKWMNLFTTATTAFEAEEVMAGTPSPAKLEMERSREGFVAILLAILEHELVIQVLGRKESKPLRKLLAEALASFVPMIMSTSPEGVVHHLDIFRTRTLPEFDPPSKDAPPGDGDVEDILDSAMALETFVLPQMHIPNTRAALYVYLNAALVGRPALDDNALFSYLHNRYQGDIQNTAIDLILASFDILANAVFRNEGAKTAQVLRSYLINKVPLYLTTLSASLFPLTAEHCIKQALSQVDQNTFPTLSAMFADTNNPNTFTDTVRQDFCFSCALHGLIPESSIEGLLGEITYQNLPSGGRYDKHTLVQQCLSDPERIQNLITELDNMDGNVGAVCHALTEVMARLCQNRETLPLKPLCSQLAKKPLSLDVILLFEKPATILRPLCDLLDSWSYEEDQGEYQPVYEEFGSILLLLLSFVYRYNLTPADLGIHTNKESFVVKLLTKGALIRPLEELTEQEAANLGRWIQGLFATDAGGLSDELLSSCPPQDFYLLIPSLFHQIILAFSRGVLTEESVKAGVEYLVDAFLVPSLITAITFVATYLWVDQKLEHKAALRILHMILLSPVSAEAASLLEAVKNSIAQPLTHSLRTYQRRDPKSQDIEPLLRALKDSLPVSRRTLAANHNELESWASTANGGLSAALKNTIVGLVTWALGPELNVPTSYTHRQLLAALQRLGAKKTLRLLVDEIILVTGDGRAEAPAPPPETLGVVYDVVASLICAPDVIAEAADAIPSTAAPGAPPTPIPSMQRRMGLLEALRHAAEDAKRTQRTEPAFAEACVRLYRRVEELLTPVVIPATVEANEAAAAAAAAAVAAEAVVQDGLALAMDVDLNGIDAASAAAGSGNGADSAGVGAGAMGDISMGMGDLEGMSLDGLGGALDFGSGADDLVLGDMTDGFNWDL